MKFLSGISVCEHVVSPDWLESSMEEGTFVGQQNRGYPSRINPSHLHTYSSSVAEEPYLLSDSEAEELFQMSIAMSLSRARKGKLLEVSLLIAHA